MQQLDLTQEEMKELQGVLQYINDKPLQDLSYTEKVIKRIGIKYIDFLERTVWNMRNQDNFGHMSLARQPGMENLFRMVSSVRP